MAINYDFLINIIVECVLGAINYEHICRELSRARKDLESEKNMKFMKDFFTRLSIS
jgi:hypothetical protein